MTQRILLVIAFACLLQVTYCIAQKPKVVSSASMFDDMVRNLAGDLVASEMIVPIGGDPHLHSPTPRDSRLVEKADLIFINGLTFEGWINELIENSGTKAKTVTITEGVDVIQSEEYKGSADPHAWMNASNGRIYIKNMKAALQELMPNHKSAIESNYLAYDAKLKALHEETIAQIETIPKDKRILITSHDAFAYFGKAYGVRLEAILGVSTEADVQTADIIRVTKVINDKKVPAIFVESTINPKLLQQIAKDNKVSIGGELYADSLGDKDSEGGTYIDMLQHNVKTIVSGLTQVIDESDVAEDGGSSAIWLYRVIGFSLLFGLIFALTKLK